MTWLTKRSQPGKINAVAYEENKMSRSWYFIRLAFLAIPWKARNNKNPRGVLFRQYHLVQAKNVKSAFEKAGYILSMSQHCDGDGVLNGERVAFKKVGILDITPLYETLKDGVELFDESEPGVTQVDVKRQTISAKRRRQMIASDERKGKTKLLDVYWGKDYDRL